MMGKRIKKILNDKNIRKLLTFFIAYKIILISIGVFGQLLIDPATTFRGNHVDNILLNSWAQYDAKTYLHLATYGYDKYYNFYPFYPFLIKILGFLGYGLAAFFISNISSLLFMTVLYLLVKDELNKNIAFK